MSRLLGAWEPQSPQWYAARRWRVGGSEIAQVRGWSPFGNADSLLAAKLSGEITPASKAQERGTRLEPGVLAWACDREGLTLDAAVSAGTYVHDAHDWALYNPDGITEQGVLVEVKTTADRSTDRGWGRAGTDAVPLYYAAQVQWGLGVLGLDRAILAVLHGATNGRPDLGLAIYRISRDDDALADLIRHGSRFVGRLRLSRLDNAA